MNAILSQIDAIPDHILSTGYSLETLRAVSAALCAASARIEIEINNRVNYNPRGLLADLPRGDA